MYISPITMFYRINHPYGSSITVHQHDPYDPHGHDVSGLLGFQGIEVRCQVGTTTWIDPVYAGCSWWIHGSVWWFSIESGWWFFPTPLKNHGVKVSWDGWNFPFLNGKSFKIPWFQSPPTKNVLVIYWFFNQSLWGILRWLNGDL